MFSLFQRNRKRKLKIALKESRQDVSAARTQDPETLLEAPLVPIYNSYFRTFPYQLDADSIEYRQLERKGNSFVVRTVKEAPEQSPETTYSESFTDFGKAIKKLAEFESFSNQNSQKPADFHPMQLGNSYFRAALSEEGLVLSTDHQLSRTITETQAKHAGRYSLKQLRLAHHASRLSQLNKHLPTSPDEDQKLWDLVRSYEPSFNVDLGKAKKELKQSVNKLSDAVPFLEDAKRVVVVTEDGLSQDAEIYTRAPQDGSDLKADIHKLADGSALNSFTKRLIEFASSDSDNLSNAPIARALLDRLAKADFSPEERIQLRKFMLEQVAAQRPDLSVHFLYRYYDADIQLDPSNENHQNLVQNLFLSLPEEFYREDARQGAQLMRYFQMRGFQPSRLLLRQGQAFAKMLPKLSSSLYELLRNHGEEDTETQIADHFIDQIYLPLHQKIFEKSTQEHKEDAENKHKGTAHLPAIFKAIAASRGDVMREIADFVQYHAADLPPHKTKIFRTVLRNTDVVETYGIHLSYLTQDETYQLETLFHAFEGGNLQACKELAASLKKPQHFISDVQGYAAYNRLPLQRKQELLFMVIPDTHLVDMVSRRTEPFEDLSNLSRANYLRCVRTACEMYGQASSNFSTSLEHLDVQPPDFKHVFQEGLKHGFLETFIALERYALNHDNVHFAQAYRDLLTDWANTIETVPTTDQIPTEIFDHLLQQTAQHCQTNIMAHKLVTLFEDEKQRLAVRTPDLSSEIRKASEEALLKPLRVTKHLANGNKNALTWLTRCTQYLSSDPNPFKYSRQAKIFAAVFAKLDKISKNSTLDFHLQDEHYLTLLPSLLRSDCSSAEMRLRHSYKGSKADWAKTVDDFLESGTASGKLLPAQYVYKQHTPPQIADHAINGRGMFNSDNVGKKQSLQSYEWLALSRQESKKVLAACLTALGNSYQNNLEDFEYKLVEKTSLRQDLDLIKLVLECQKSGLMTGPLTNLFATPPSDKVLRALKSYSNRLVSEDDFLQAINQPNRSRAGAGPSSKPSRTRNSNMGGGGGGFSP